MIRGVGPVYAKKLVRAFGEKVFDIIETNRCARSMASARFGPPAFSPPGPNRRPFDESKARREVAWAVERR